MMIKSEIKLSCKEILKIVEDYIIEDYLNNELEMIREEGTKVEFESIEFNEVVDEKNRTSYLFPDDDISFIFTIQEKIKI